MRSVTLDAGEVLYREGEDSDSVYYVETGEVSVSVHKNGKSTILAKRGPSDLIGEMGVIRTSPRSATITAIKESTFVKIPAGLWASRRYRHEAAHAALPPACGK
jgi:CRP-like cAMP-binding protein